MKIIFYIAIPVVIILVFWLFRKWRAEKPDWTRSTLDRAEKVMKTTPVLTPAGKKVYLETPVPDLGAIDRGIEHTFRKLICAGYPVNRSRHNDIKIVVFESEKAPVSGDDCFRVPITYYDPYWNGPFDMMKDSDEFPHYILASGQAIYFGEPYGDVIVIPYSTDAEYVERAVGYEWEHVGYAWYDFPKYLETQYHLTGGHPLIASCPGDENLTARDIVCLPPLIKR